MGRNDDAPRVRIPREHLATAIIGFDRRLHVDCLNVENLAGKCHCLSLLPRQSDLPEEGDLRSRCFR